MSQGLDSLPHSSQRVYFQGYFILDGNAVMGREWSFSLPDFGQTVNNSLFIYQFLYQEN